MLARLPRRRMVGGAQIGAEVTRGLDGVRLVQDYFVGIVGILCGLMIATASVLQWAWWYELPTVQKGVHRWGMATTRVLMVGVGTLLILYGGAIALGWTKNAGRLWHVPSPGQSASHVR